MCVSVYVFGFGAFGVWLLQICVCIGNIFVGVKCTNMLNYIVLKRSHVLKSGNEFITSNSEKVIFV